MAKMVSIRPTGSCSITSGSPSGFIPVTMDYYSRITDRKITEEGQRILREMTHMMRQFNDPIKPTLNIKGHKFG